MPFSLRKRKGSVRYERVVYNARLGICLAGGKESDIMVYMVE